MKLIHTADLHLGSKMEAKFPPEKARLRRSELRTSFLRLIERAKELGATAVLIAGDLFDTDPPTPEDQQLFFGAVKANPEITFLVLRGNHDRRMIPDGDLGNLILFGDDWTGWECGEVAVRGIEITKENCETLYNSYRPVPGKLNIAVLHGIVGTSPAPDTVVLSRLENRGIDYLALGHIHDRRDGKLGDRGVWAYPGCPEGRGFDEPGEKGFLLLNVENGVLQVDFIPHACRTLREIDCDLSGAADGYAAQIAASDAVAGIPLSDPIRLNLVGSIGFEAPSLADDIETALNRDGRRFFVSVKNKTVRAFDLGAIRDELSLRGEFLRLTEGKTDLSDEEKAAVLDLGLRALSGQSLD